MTPSLFLKLKKEVCSLPYIILFLFITGCQFFGGSKPNEMQAIRQAVQQSPNQIRTIYIQSFTGQKIQTVKEIFSETIEEQDIFTFVELLPDNYIGLKILRIEVTDYAAWESDEEIDTNQNKTEETATEKQSLRRRNAIVGINITLFDAESGTLILRKKFSQPFQQIYIGTEAIANMPDQTLELRRLCKILIFKILTAFYQHTDKITDLHFENGFGKDWFSIYIHNLGDTRIKKGNRLAMSGDLEKAMWMWKIILYKPEKDEPLDIYIKNRASAYYNLGIVYHMQKDWWFAAKMFSMANRLQQKLKYAQAWGNNIQMWLDEQRKPSEQVEDEFIAEKTEEPTDASVKGLLKKKPLGEEKTNILKYLEQNKQFLLKPRELWPLDPYLKTKQTIQIENDNTILTEDEIETKPVPLEESPVDQPTEPDDSGISNDLIKEVPEQPVDLTN